MKQRKLFREKIQTQFGGTLLKGRRKSARPLHLKNTHHLVLKATTSTRLLRNRTQVQSTLKEYGAKFGVKIYALAVHCDHIHTQFLASSRAAYLKWIRAVTSVLVQKVRGLKFSLRFWSRIVAWGTAYHCVAKYIATNAREGDLILGSWQRMEMALEETLRLVPL